MNRGLLIILKCFLTRFTHLISSANHWLTLWHSKEKQFLKISPLSSNFPDSNPPCLLGHNTFSGQSWIPRATCLPLWAGLKVLLEKYRKTSSNTHGTGPSHWGQLTLLYLQSHYIYYFYQASLNLVVLDTSIPAVPAWKQKHFLTLLQEYSACAATTASFD